MINTLVNIKNTITIKFKIMDNVKQSENFKQRKWYNGHTFPLVPVLTTRKADEHNTFHFSFHWLFFKVWSLDSFDFEVALVFDLCHWGVGLTAILPYLRIVVAIPPPEKLSTWWQNNMWRRP